MTSTEDLARKLLITPGTRLWVHPPRSPLTAALEADDDVVTSTAEEAEVVLLLVRSRAEVDAVLVGYVPTIREARAVWIVYPKGNLADVNRDSLWVQLAPFGWRAVAQVSFSEELSALRVRPLRPGETLPV